MHGYLEEINVSKEEKEKKVSAYTILGRWLSDGSRTTKLPEDVEKDKSISHMYLLYYFRASPYGLVISKLFNNWNLFSLERNEVLYLMKECVLSCGYKPPFSQKVPAKKNKLVDELVSKYPYLKKDEVFMLVEIIDNSEEKDSIYEMFGLYTTKSKKLTKAQKEEFMDKLEKNKVDKPQVGLNDLMENFQ